MRPQAIADVCGNWSDEDSIKKGFDVHFYCGVGWPESLTYFSPITEYCVAHHKVCSSIFRELLVTATNSPSCLTIFFKLPSNLGPGTPSA